MPVHTNAPFVAAGPAIKPSQQDKREVINDLKNLPRYKILHSVVAMKRDEAVRAALYAADPDVRSVNAGRAQAWVEIMDLIEGK